VSCGSSITRGIELTRFRPRYSGVTARLQGLVFETLRSWLQAGELDATLIARSPLFAFAFDALGNIELFDHAVDVVCDLIHETQEVEDNVEVVQLIVPRVIALRDVFHQAVSSEEDDSVRGFCRIFTEAGETYRQLILAHPDTFLPLVQVIGECSAYHDLDIVPITFDFWWKLAQALGKQAEHGDNPASSQYAPFMEVYSKLQESMTVHLRFPEDESSQTAESRDEFRAFRHRMGDTLKDCCSVLGANVCMKRAYDSVMAALQKGPAASWQEIEAPLFSIRAMGAQVDPSDDSVLPMIMDMLPGLPKHTRIQYAAILVISRYTHWIAAHPQYLPFQLSYISEGFSVTENDVSLAAAMAMKFMCQDCQAHLVPYLGQLHSFVTTAGLSLTMEEKIDVAEAIGYVIASMGQAEAAEALQKFTQPLLEMLQSATGGPRLLTRNELDPVVGK
jgi:transportin-3